MRVCNEGRNVTGSDLNCLVSWDRIDQVLRFLGPFPQPNVGQIPWCHSDSKSGSEEANTLIWPGYMKPVLCKVMTTFLIWTLFANDILPETLSFPGTDWGSCCEVEQHSNLVISCLFLWQTRTLNQREFLINLSIPLLDGSLRKPTFNTMIHISNT